MSNKRVRKETYLTFDEVGEPKKITCWNVYSRTLPDMLVGSGFKTKKQAMEFERARFNSL